MVEKVTAYAWDPYFTCNTTKDKTPLVDNIRNEMNKSLASECRFLDPPNNLTIEMTGFNLDSPGKFRVSFIKSMVYLVSKMHENVSIGLF